MVPFRWMLHSTGQSLHPTIACPFTLPSKGDASQRSRSCASSMTSSTRGMKVVPMLGLGTGILSRKLYCRVSSNSESLDTVPPQEAREVMAKGEMGECGNGHPRHSPRKMGLHPRSCIQGWSFCFQGEKCHSHNLYLDIPWISLTGNIRSL